MSRKQKLRNAVILGLMLSSVTAGSVWAAEGTDGTDKPVFVKGQEDNVDYTGDEEIDVEINEGIAHEYNLSFSIGEESLSVKNNFVSGIGAQGWAEKKSGIFGYTYYEKHDASLTVTGNNNNLTINIGNNSGDNSAAVGIFAGGELIVKDLIPCKTEGSVVVKNIDALVINATTHNEKEGYGILATNNGTVNVTAGSITINATKDETASGDVYGVKADNDILGIVDAGQVNITATEGDINISASYKDAADTSDTEDSTAALADEDNGLNLGTVKGSSTAVVGDVAITAEKGNINLEAIADFGSAVAIGSGSGTINAAKDVNAVAKSNVNLGSFVPGIDIPDIDIPGIDIPGIDIGVNTTAIGNKEIIAGGNVGAEATSIIGNVAGIDNDKKITAGGNVESTAGTVLGNATAITGDGIIDAEGNVTAMAGSLIGDATGITGGGSISADGDVTGIAVTGTGMSIGDALDKILPVIGGDGENTAITDVIKKIEQYLPDGFSGDAVGIKDKTITAGGSVNGIAGSITGDATGIAGGTITSTNGNVYGMAGSLLGDATGIATTGIATTGISTITAESGDVTGIALSGLGTDSLLGMVKDVVANQFGEDSIVNDLIGILPDSVGNDSKAVGINNAGIINAANGNVTGVAGSISGNAIGIDNAGTIGSVDEDIDNAGKNVTAIANSIFGNATGITGTGTINATGNVIAQAGSYSGNATGIDGGTITAENVTGIAVTGKGVDELLQEIGVLEEVSTDANAEEQVQGNAIGINGGTITATGTVYGMAGSIGGDATGIKGATINNAEKVIAIADTVNENSAAYGINGGSITANEVIAQAGSVDGNATAITSAGTITADTVTGLAGSVNGNATGIESATIVDADKVIAIVGSVNGTATGISGTGNITANEVIAQAVSITGAATGITSSDIAITGNVTGIAGSYSGNATGVISTENITVDGSVTGIAVTGKAPEELTKEFAALGIENVKNAIDEAVKGQGIAVGIEGGNITATSGNIYGMAGSYSGDAIGIKGTGTITATSGSVIGIADTVKGAATGIAGSGITANDVIAQAGSVDGIATGINSAGNITATSGNVYGMAGSISGEATGIKGTGTINASSGSVIGIADTVKGAATGIAGSGIIANDVIAQAGSVDGAANGIISKDSIEATGGNVISMAGSVNNAATAISGKDIKAGGEIIGMASSFKGDAIGIISNGSITAGGTVTGIAVTGKETEELEKEFAALNINDIEDQFVEPLQGDAIGINSAGNITADHGPVIGMAVSVDGNAIGIKGDGNVVSKHGSVIAGADSINGNAVAITGHGEEIKTKGEVIAQAGSENGDAVGIYGDRVINAGNNNIVIAGSINGDAVGIYGGNSLTAKHGNNIIVATSANGEAYGIYADGKENSLTAANGHNIVLGDTAGIKAVNDSTVTFSGKTNKVIGGKYGVAANNSDVTFTATNGDNYFVSANSRDDADFENTDGEFSNAVNVSGGAQFTANGQNNILMSGEIINGYGDETAVSAVGGNATFTAAENNELYGAVYANNGNVNITAQNGDNVVLSATHGRTAGDDESGIHLVSALYAAEGSAISLSATNGVNRIYSNFDFVEGHKQDREITVWAENGGDVNLKGAVEIVASNYGEYTNDGVKGNALGIAVSAGSKGIDVSDTDASTVDIDYTSAEHDSLILGDVVAGKNGVVNIGYFNAEPLMDNGFTKGGKLQIAGNLLAANGGKLNVDFAKGSYWEGRADDYGDADIEGHEGFFNPAFSNDITSGGTVDVTMDEGYWMAVGQSWLTNFNADDTIIDMVTKGSNAVSIKNMEGSGSTFIVGLNNDNHGDSSMLYIKEGNADINIVVNGTINGLEDVNTIDSLRFATVGEGIRLTNSDERGTYINGVDGGMFNTKLYVEEHKYDISDTAANDEYNGGETVDGDKPGSNGVEDFFELNSDDNKKTAADIALLDENADNITPENWEIVGFEGDGYTAAGETILSLGKVNYSNAVYMDRFNKRMGEARFIDGDDGVWVRLRHDRIGKENAFRSQNTMYEIGYDIKHVQDSGEHRMGLAVDYMDGESSFTGVNGRGEVSRKGLWAYDSWMGEKGHYRDIVAKWGHLSNDFDFTTSWANDVNADFSNNVYSISAEYGKKNAIGSDWYFEPQVQLQYAHVTEADYGTSMNDTAQTQLHNDAFNSLIARAGFRLGRDISDHSTVYFKGDVLHEFMGDQDIYAKDSTTKDQWTNVGYENSGTWYDLGFGFATKVSKASYAYLDFEKSFGNDNDETYQINAGMQWSF